MYTQIRLDKSIAGLIALGLPLHAVLYRCWRGTHRLNTRDLLSVKQHMSSTCEHAWLQRKTVRSGLGCNAAMSHRDEVQRRCLALIRSLTSTTLRVLPIPAEDEIFGHLQMSLVNEVSVSGNALLFIFASVEASESDKRHTWLSAGFMAQQLSVIAAEYGLGSFSSHGHEYPGRESHGGLSIEYVLWIG